MQRYIMPINISIPIIVGERGDQEQGEKRRGEEDGEDQADRQVLPCPISMYNMLDDLCLSPQG
mgnify:CR=1 FL=1